MKRALFRALLLVVVLGVLIVSLKVTVAWWRGELSLMEEGNWIWVMLFPLSLAIWWRYFSIFGCEQPACLHPDDSSKR